MTNPAFELRVNATVNGVHISDTHSVAVVTPPVGANITGNTSITTAGTYTWLANASGGNGTYTYNWEYRVGTAAWTSVGTGSSDSRALSAGNPGFGLRVTVTPNGSSASDTHLVSVNIPATTLSAAVTGDDYLINGQVGYWSASVSGGSAPYTYQW